MDAAPHKKPRVWSVGLLAGACAAVLHFCAFPNVNAWWAGLVCLSPLILWAYAKPPRRAFLTLGFLAFFFSWSALLIWLRHVYPGWGWVGVFFLAFFNSCFAWVWLWALWWVGRRYDLSGPARLRIFSILGLAAFWVVLEWLRGWLFTGFPWLPLSVSQWVQPAMLQLAQWTGGWGISFVLVFINLCVAGYLRSLYTLVKTGDTATKQMRVKMGSMTFRVGFHMELYLGVFALLACVSLMIGMLGKMHAPRELLFKAGLVQPWAPPDEKWDAELILKNWSTLKALTLSLRAEEPDLYVWPEAATPLAVFGRNSEDMRAAVEELVTELDKPLVMGNLVWTQENYNGIFYVSPRHGVSPIFYAKTHLVPFGEYVPFQETFSFIQKISPIEGRFYPGKFLDPLRISVRGQSLNMGALVCYEDIFPQIARALAANGTDFFFVASNNAWYGTEAGATQHAAHAVLRAVETRRPVMRCSNNGWSGWVDEFGYAYELRENAGGQVSLQSVSGGEKGSVYFRGTGAFNVARSPHYAGKTTFFTRHGAWFVIACGGLVILSALRLRLPAKKS